MGNVRMEARQINYRGGEVPMNVEEAIKNSGSTYVLPIAAADTLGGVKIGDGLSIDSETGILSADTYSLPTASDETKGGVKVGNDLKMLEDTLNVEVQIETMEGNTYEFDLSSSDPPGFGVKITKKYENTIVWSEVMLSSSPSKDKIYDGRFRLIYNSNTYNYTLTLLKDAVGIVAGTSYTWNNNYYPPIPELKLVFEAETENGTASEEIQKIFDRIPPAPSANGTYVLQANVSSGVPTYSWVSTT